MFRTWASTHFKAIHAAIPHSIPLPASSELSVFIADKDQKYFALNADFLAKVDRHLSQEAGRAGQ
jgi:hypothetical protein